MDILDGGLLSAAEACATAVVFEGDSLGIGILCLFGSVRLPDSFIAYLCWHGDFQHYGWVVFPMIPFFFKGSMKIRGTIRQIYSARTTLANGSLSLPHLLSHFLTHLLTHSLAPSCSPRLFTLFSPSLLDYCTFYFTSERKTYSSLASGRPSSLPYTTVTYSSSPSFSGGEGGLSIRW
jgi:hypothetical protein